MKILIFLGLLGSICSAVLAVMARSSLKDLRAQKDSLNRDTLEIHTGVNSKIGDIAATNATFTVTAKSAKDEDLATKVALSEIKTKEGHGEFVKRPPNTAVNAALSKWKQVSAPRPVQRSGIPATGV